MPVALDRLRLLATATPEAAWAAAIEAARDIFAPAIGGSAGTEILRREREAAALDLFLAGAGWDLWDAFSVAVPRTADALAEWWSAQVSGRAVLILDGLSLRELPWLLAGANERGFKLHQMRVTGTELPADTTPFAKALGFAQRSALQNDGAGSGHRLPGARTEATALPWADCAALIGAEPRWALWHEWLDDRIHALDKPGQGLRDLAREAHQHLGGAPFWTLVEKLAIGRRLVITSDHGYAATGEFADTADPGQARHLKDRFGSKRSAAVEPPGADGGGFWVPPVDLRIENKHGSHHCVLGRRKWRSQGGYPTLAHGGLSILEVAVPFIELSKP